jgi:thioredoxin-dependent peroxiredoxin
LFVPLGDQELGKLTIDVRICLSQRQTDAVWLLYVQEYDVIGDTMKSYLLSAIALMACTLSVRAENPTNFTLHSAVDDSKFELSEHRGKTVVLHFLLKTECPYCLRYTNEYARLSESTPEVVHVFLKPDSLKDIKDWAGKLDKQDAKSLPKVYRDPGAKLAKQFKIPDGYKFHGQSVHYPALVALDGQGKELFRYVGKSNSDRMSSKEFQAKLDSIKK